MLYVDWERIRRAQRKLRMDDAELARQVGTTRQNIVNWRYQKSAPQHKPEILEKICEVLGLSYDTITIDPKIIQRELFTELLEGMVSLTKLENIIDENPHILTKVISLKDYKSLRKQVVELRQHTGQVYRKLEIEKDLLIEKNISVATKDINESE